MGIASAWVEGDLQDLKFRRGHVTVQTDCHLEREYRFKVGLWKIQEYRNFVGPQFQTHKGNPCAWPRNCNRWVLPQKSLTARRFFGVVSKEKQRDITHHYTYFGQPIEYLTGPNAPRSELLASLRGTRKTSESPHVPPK